MQQKQFFRKPIITNDQSDISLDDLLIYVSQIPFGGLDLLIALSGITNSKYERPIDRMVFLPASLAMMAIIATKRIDGDIDSVEEIPSRVMNKLLRMSASADGLPISRVHIPLDIIVLLSRIIGLQIALQGDLVCRVVRFSCILGLAGMDFSGLSELADDELGKINNNNMLDVFTFLFWLYSTVSHGLTFTKEDLLSSTSSSSVLAGCIEELLPIFSCSSEDVKKHIKKSQERRLTGFSIAYDLFCRKPLIKLPDSRYLRMPEVFSRSTASQYLYFARRQLLLNDNTKSSNITLGKLGKRFEIYAFNLLSTCLPGYSAYPDIVFSTRKGEFRSPDGVYSNGCSRDVILMQAKLKPPTAGLLLGDIGISYLENDLENTYAEMFCQSIKFLHELKVKMDSGLITQNAIEMAQCVISANRIRLISLVPTTPPIFHWGPARQKLWETIKRKLIDQAPKALAWFNELRDSGVIHDCLLLCDTESFELFSIKTEGIAITNDLDSWWDGIQNPTDANVVFPIDLREYIVEEYGARDNITDSFIIRAYKRLFKRATEVLEDKQSIETDNKNATS